MESAHNGYTAQYEQERSSFSKKVDLAVILHLFALALVPMFTSMVLIIAYQHLAWVWVAAHVAWTLLTIKIVDAHHRLLQRNHERRLEEIDRLCHPRVGVLKGKHKVVVVLLWESKTTIDGHPLDGGKTMMKARVHFPRTPESESFVVPGSWITSLEWRKP